MARTFKTNVVLTSPLGDIKTFGPDDEVPEWAKVGEHVLVPLDGTEDPEEAARVAAREEEIADREEEAAEAAEDESVVDAVVEEEQGPVTPPTTQATDAEKVDFTKPATRRGRPAAKK